MNQTSLPVLLIAAVILAALAIAIVFLRKRRGFSRDLAEINRTNAERQQFVIAQGDELSRAVSNTTLRADEFKRITDAIVAEIALRNDAGCLDAYLADTRDFLAEEVAKRAAT